jgi:hypothetical protein
MISVQRIPVLGLANVVNDPAFRNLIEAGYRPVLQIPVEERDGNPEIFVVMVRSDVAKSGNLTVWLLGAILLVHVAVLVVSLLR